MCQCLPNSQKTVEPRVCPVWLRVCALPSILRNTQHADLRVFGFLLQHWCLSGHIPVLLLSEDHALPEGRECRGVFSLPFLFALIVRLFVSLWKTLTHRGRHVGRARVMLLCGPQMKSLCSETCFVGLSFRKSNCHAVCRQLFLPLRAPQPAGDQAHGGALHGLSQ